MKTTKSKAKQREIVINAQYGGFGLSDEGIRHYATLKGFNIFAYKAEFKNGKSSFVQLNEKPSDFFCTFYSKVPINKTEDYNQQTKICHYDIPRDDPDLIKTVKALGKAADGFCAKLKIVEIPADVEWEISEYDGYERVEEAHRKWD